MGEGVTPRSGHLGKYIHRSLLFCDFKSHFLKEIRGRVEELGFEGQRTLVIHLVRLNVTNKGATSCGLKSTVKHERIMVLPSYWKIPQKRQLP